MFLADLDDGLYARDLDEGFVHDQGDGLIHDFGVWIDS
jgi:hypothetical protein